MALNKKKSKSIFSTTEKSLFENTDALQLTANEEYVGHLAAIIESSGDAIISKSMDGTIKSWNRGSEKMFEFSAKEAVGENISIIIPPEYLNEEKEIIEKISHNKTVDHFETVRNKKNGTQFYVSLTVSPIKDRTGKIIGVSKIARDITARKKVESEIIQANKELSFQNEEKEKRAAELLIANKELAYQNEEKEKRAAELNIANIELAFQNDEKGKRAAELIIANAELAAQNAEKIDRAAQLESVNNELESFSYSVSHDLRAPLRAIQGYSQILKEDLENKIDEENVRILNNIINNTRKMGQLIDDLLAFSRLGRKELIKIKVPMNDLVTTLCNEFKKEQIHRNIEFIIHPLAEAQGDSVALQCGQIFSYQRESHY